MGKYSALKESTSCPVDQTVTLEGSKYMVLTLGIVLPSWRDCYAWGTSKAAKPPEISWLAGFQFNLLAILLRRRRQKNNSNAPLIPLATQASLGLKGKRDCQEIYV